jgi:4-guanidinobutyraldehyde dehydrogenase/NAD-dependent aldehyde dehydrogenase
VASEKNFRPVLSVMAFRTPEEAFERANNHPYGLSAGVWTKQDWRAPVFLTAKNF